MATFSKDGMQGLMQHARQIRLPQRQEGVLREIQITKSCSSRLVACLHQKMTKTSKVSDPFFKARSFLFVLLIEYDGIYGKTQYHGQCIVPDLVGALTNSYSGSTRYGGERGAYNASGASTRDGRARESKYNKATGPKAN